MNRTAGIGLGLLLLVAGCDGHTSLGGEVVGPDGKPIAGASVRLIEPDLPPRGPASTTDEFGRYSISLTHAPFDVPLVVTATADGYEPYRKEFKAREWASFPRTIVLQPDPQAPAAED
ncbi:carboxypeptidase-like regulatory domain-containing protein [Gemmata sp.]|uniref:carboxypeptidase-like regulatory domain-containing protein n=1 Tax=Gemmata sp. TaxID=1914242 RepID=UPI003F6F22EE